MLLLAAKLNDSSMAGDDGVVPAAVVTEVSFETCQSRVHKCQALEYYQVYFQKKYIYEFNIKRFSN